MRYDEVFEGNEKKSFFRDEEQRNLWLRLNAERIRYARNRYFYLHSDDLGSIDKPNTPLWISNNQLTYDEYVSDAPRLSLVELSSMSHENLLILSEERESETMKKIWDEIFNNDDDDWVVYGADEDFL